MQAVEVEHYIRRATDFLEGMELTRSDQAYWNSSGLLAIHSAISFSDALRVGLGEKTLSADAHSKAAISLDQYLVAKGFDDRTGLEHFKFLLKWRNRVVYDRRHLDRTDYEALFTRAERFARWARKTGSQLRIEGWNDDER